MIRDREVHSDITKLALHAPHAIESLAAAAVMQQMPVNTKQRAPVR